MIFIPTGIRGKVINNLFYELTGFVLNTKEDFYRYRILPARPLETFYGNAGETKRFGLETYVDWKPLRDVKIQLAYTYSHFKYTRTSKDSMLTGGEMLPAIVKGNYLPNSPEHQFYLEIEYKFLRHFVLGLSSEYQSKWYVYTNRNITQNGFNLYHARISYQFKIGNLSSDISIYGKNLTDQEYIAFTEPDPDGNSYQPGAKRELFGSLRIRF